MKLLVRLGRHIQQISYCLLFPKKCFCMSILDFHEGAENLLADGLLGGLLSTVVVLLLLGGGDTGRAGLGFSAGTTSSTTRRTDRPNCEPLANGWLHTMWMRSQRWSFASSEKCSALGGTKKFLKFQASCSSKYSGPCNLRPPIQPAKIWS